MLLVLQRAAGIAAPRPLIGICLILAKISWQSCRRKWRHFQTWRWWRLRRKQHIVTLASTDVASKMNC